MRLSDLLLLALGAVVIAGLAGAPYRTYAAEPPACISISDAFAALEDAKGTLLELVDVPGKTVDQLLIASVGGSIMLWGSMKGCMVGGAIRLDVAEDKGVPA